MVKINKGKKKTPMYKEIEALQKQIKIARNNGKMKDLASLHNELGNIYRINESYEDALEHHEEEVNCCRKYTPDDKMGVGIGYRNIGEVYFDMKDEGKAIPYIKSYLELALRLKNVVEEQRARLTLGRMYLGFSEKADLAKTERENYVVRSEKQFRKAYYLLQDDKLRSSVGEKVLKEMESGAMLNLGIVLETQKNYTEAISWILKAITIGKQNSLHEYNFRCYLSLYGIYFKTEEYSEAKKTAGFASTVAAHLNLSEDEWESKFSESKAMIYLKEVTSAIKLLKKLRKKIKSADENNELLEDVELYLKTCVKILKLEDEAILIGETNTKRQKEIYEAIADSYVKINCFNLAIANYKDCLKYAIQLCLSKKDMAKIYFSIAVTYKDKHDWRNAIIYFKKEMESHDDEKFVDQFRTQTNIAICLEKLKNSPEEVSLAYEKAISLARKCQSFKKIVQGLFNYTEYLKSVNESGRADRHKKELNELKELHNITDFEEPEDDSQDLLNSDDDDDNEINLDELSSENESEEDDENEEELLGKRNKKVSFSRVNEKGESSLHVAAQKGDVKEVKRLLKFNHPLNPTDNSGWTPLHEASNFGHLEVVELLVAAGANVNFAPSGAICNRITPLMDAAGNGHFDVMRALINGGAKVTSIDKNGKYPIDSLIEWWKRLKEEGNATEDLKNGYIEMKAYLKELMEKSGKKYTSKDEIKTLKSKTKGNTENVKPIMMKSTIGDMIPAKVVEDGRDYDSPNRAVKLYSSAMKELRRRNKSRTFSDDEYDDEDSLLSKRNNSFSDISRENIEALLPESQVIHEESEWLINDYEEPEILKNKKKREKKIGFSFIAGENDGQIPTTSKNSLLKSKPKMKKKSAPPKPKSFLEGRQNSFEEEWNSNSNSNSTNIVLDSDSENDKYPLAVMARKKDNNKTKIQILSDDDEDDSFLRDIDIDDSTQFSIPNGNLSPEIRNLNRIADENNIISDYDDDIFNQPNPNRRKRDRDPIEDVQQLVRNDVGRKKARNSNEILKLKIQFPDKTLLIPLTETQLEYTIEWLAEESSRRYFQNHGIKPIINLKTFDGADLSGIDPIRHICSEIEPVLVAHILSYDLPPLNDRITNTFMDKNLTLDEDFKLSMNICQSSNILNLKDFYLRSKYNLALFQALKCQSSLREIYLSGCSLFDDGIKNFCSILSTLSGVVILDLSCNGITAAGFSCLASEIIKMNNDGNPLMLNNINISHNSLGDSVGSNLTKIINILPQLKRFTLIDCDLGLKLFSNQAEISSCLNNARLEEFNLRLNKIQNTEICMFYSGLQNSARKALIYGYDGNDFLTLS